MIFPKTQIWTENKERLPSHKKKILKKMKFAEKNNKLTWSNKAICYLKRMSFNANFSNELLLKCCISKTYATVCKCEMTKLLCHTESAVSNTLAVSRHRLSFNVYIYICNQFLINVKSDLIVSMYSILILQFNHFQLFLSCPAKLWHGWS